jgi:RNA polymerase sigma-70 factor (ECF subfamily)
VPDDLELMRGACAGDENAFTALYRRHQGGLYRFALQMSGAQATAEDVVQETFLALIRGTAHYDPARGPVGAFLYGVARKHVLRALERMPAEVIDPERAAAADDPHVETVRNRAVAATRAAVLALPVHYREVVTLCDLQELDYAAAAGVLGCAVGTVRSRLHRARQLLAERLGPSQGAAPQSNPARCET